MCSWVRLLHLHSIWGSPGRVKLENKSQKMHGLNAFMAYSCSVNSRHQLIQYKVIHRLHYSRVKLHSFYPASSPLCIRCKKSDGTLAHMFWFCERLRKFWSDVFSCYSEVYGLDLHPNPETAILGWPQQLEILSLWKTLSIQYGMILAKKSFLKVWNKDISPCFDNWLVEFSNTWKRKKKIRYEMSGKARRFKQIWQPLLLV